MIISHGPEHSLPAARENPSIKMSKIGVLI